MSSLYAFTKHKLRAIVAIVASLAVAQLGFGLQIASAATLTGGYVSLSDSRPSTASVSYTFDADNITLSSIKCIQFDFGTAADGTGDAGLTVAGATYDTAASDYVPDGQVWTVTPTEGTDVVALTQATGETPGSATNGTIELDGITNGPTADNDYFVKVNTYDNVDCSSSAVDNSVVTFIYTAGQSVSLSVDPSLSFTVAGTSSSTSCNGSTSTVATTATTVPFATVTTGANAIAVQNLTTSTNAASGYTTFTRYTAVPTGPGGTISDVAGATNSSPQNFSGAGTEAFGYTTNDAVLSATGDGADRFTNPATQYAAFTTGNAEVAYSAGTASSQVTCVGYQVGIGGATEAGTYTTTVIFTTTPIY